MILSQSEQESLCLYVANQLNAFFPDENPVLPKFLLSFLSQTLERVEYCFSHIADRYFFDGNNVLFSHLHGDQYGMFLYFFANSLYRKGEDTSICSKLFALNKMLHGIDAFYEVELPDVFRWVHPLGTVLGRGNYFDYFLVYQRCGIGSNKNIYPRLGKFCSLHPGSSILGNCIIGDHCELGAGALLLDQSLEESILYVGVPGNFRKIRREANTSYWRNIPAQ